MEKLKEGFDVFVGQLPYNVTDNELHELASQCATVVRAKVITDHDTGASRGFGFIRMETQAGADSVVKALHGHNLQGRRITVRIATAKVGR